MKSPVNTSYHIQLEKCTCAPFCQEGREPDRLHQFTPKTKADKE